jgi:two-component system cell cycle response regulator
MKAPDSNGDRTGDVEDNSPARDDRSATAITHAALPAVRLAGTSPTTSAEMPPVRAPRMGSSRLELPDQVDEPVTEVGIRDVASRTTPRQVPKRDRAVLLRMDGAQAGQIHVLGKRTFRIGRHPKNDIRVDDTGISRFHACIEWENDRHTVEDLGSRNGTFIGARTVIRKELRDGDWIQLGPRVSFRYSWTDANQEALFHRLYESSTRDALTGVYNRRHFEERLSAEIAYALRHKGDVALILVDVDHFKRVNDVHGHQAGDAVLQQLAVRAAHRLRTEDVLARFGGEEFAVILRGTSTLGAGLVAERLRALIAALPMIFETKPIPVTISAGCASLESCTRPSAQDLIAVADRRLYRAKKAGRNRVEATE